MGCSVVGCSVVCGVKKCGLIDRPLLDWNGPSRANGGDDINISLCHQFFFQELDPSNGHVTVVSSGLSALC